MKDGVVRRGVKRVALCFFTIDLFLMRRVFLRGQRLYELKGSCSACGACCETPSVRVSRFVWSFSLLGGLVLWWYHAVYGFRLLERDASQRAFIFRCTHFQPDAGSCDSYASRPGMCRDYPRMLLYQPSPELFESCTHRPVYRHSDRFLAALDGKSIDDEKLSEVKEKLKLEESASRGGPSQDQ